MTIPTHSEYFTEAYVALRLGFRGHWTPHRTQPLAYSYRIKNHIRLEQTITLKYKADSKMIFHSHICSSYKYQCALIKNPGEQANKSHTNNKLGKHYPICDVTQMSS